MGKRMIGIPVLITRYVSDDPQPGIVACEFLDAHGRRWEFIEKTAIVSSEHLDALTSYPQPGIIACEVVGRSQGATGRELLLIDTERPWGVESVEGSTRFEVLAEWLREWDWEEGILKVWTGRG